MDPPISWVQTLRFGRFWPHFGHPSSLSPLLLTSPCGPFSRPSRPLYSSELDLSSQSLAKLYSSGGGGGGTGGQPLPSGFGHGLQCGCRRNAAEAPTRSETLRPPSAMKYSGPYLTPVISSSVETMHSYQRHSPTARSNEATPP